MRPSLLAVFLSVESDQGLCEEIEKNKGSCWFRVLEYKIGTLHLKMIASGINLVMTVIGFGVSTMFIVFVCTRLLCARIQMNASRRAFPIASRSNLSLVSTSLWFSALFLYLVGCCNVFSMIFCVNWSGFYMVFGFGIEWVELVWLDFSFFFFFPVFNWVSFICLSNFGYFDYSFIVLRKLMWACFMVFCFVILWVE
jgi:hypothetical protein